MKINNNLKDKKMTRNNKIVEAIQLIKEARELVRQALAGSGDLANFEAYGSYGLNQALGEGNPYDDSLHSLLNDIDQTIYEPSAGDAQEEAYINAYVD